MDDYEITYVRDFRQYGRTVKASSFAEAESLCNEGEFVSGLVVHVSLADEQLVSDMRKRVGEAVREVAHG